tara:strand:+ start:239 stop:805 length:567 start_codon:yes stop_codon:yes gene_type:complete
MISQYFSDSGNNIDDLDTESDQSSINFENLQDDLEDAEEFVFKAELTDAYQEDYNLTSSEVDISEQISMNNSSLSTGAFNYEGFYNIDTEAGEIIKDANLQEAYLEKGFIDSGDMLEAEHDAAINEDWEQPTLQNSSQHYLSDGGDFIKESLLEEDYLENGTLSEDIVYDAISEAYENEELIDYLLFD